MSQAQVDERSFLTPREVAEKYGVPYHQVMRMIYEQRLLAEKVGWMWIVQVEHLPKEWPPPKKT